MRVGTGYDVHTFSQTGPLILGGVEIPYVKGLHGHSDADVLTHAVCDAILGAAGLHDIGCHFPDTDPQWENVSSLLLLERCVDLAREAGWVVENVDVTVVAENPKIGPHVEAMCEQLQPRLASSGGPGAVNVKATTNEGLGFVGRGEGIWAQAVALLTRA